MGKAVDNHNTMGSDLPQRHMKSFPYTDKQRRWGKKYGDGKQILRFQYLLLSINGDRIHAWRHFVPAVNASLYDFKEESHIMKYYFSQISYNSCEFKHIYGFLEKITEARFSEWAIIHKSRLPI